MNDYRTISEGFGLGDPRDRMIAIKQLSDESGTSNLEARDALKATGYDIGEARNLLREQGSWETPEMRRAKIVESIENAESYKQLLREEFEQQIALIDRQIASLKKELASLESQGATYCLSGLQMKRQSHKDAPGEEI